MKDLYKRLGAFRLCIVAHCTDTEIEQFDTCLLDLRSLIAHATEMDAVFKAKDRPDKPGRWFHYDCTEGKDGWLNYSENDIAACEVNPPTCGKFIGPFNFALTETKRPATTGEMTS